MVFAPIQNKRLLHDRGIKNAIKTGRIAISPAPLDEQFQPNTLDARIGEVFVYDNEARLNYNDALLSKGKYSGIDEDMPQSFAKHYADEPDIPIIIPSRAYAEIFLHERILFNPRDYEISAELRSGRGRLGLLQQKTSIETILGKMFIGIMNFNPNPIILYGQSRFANLFFHPKNADVPFDGHVVTNAARIRKLLPELVKEKCVMTNGYINFCVGEKILRYEKDITLDTKSLPSNMYAEESTKNSVVLKPFETAVVELAPQVSLPDDVGIRLLHNLPFTAQEMRRNGLLASNQFQLNAGWIDTGYSGKVTAHPTALAFHRIIREGNYFAVGVVYEYLTKPDRSYGADGLSSHYQNSSSGAVKS